MRFNEYKNLDLAQINREMQAKWNENHTFEKSIELLNDSPSYVFYEGPPSANGIPGIHHVMARSIKDIFCRYQTLNGKQVKRKAGWDTHGLPVELGVEKALGITKEDIGKTISIEKYNEECKKDVMKYTDKWEQLTDMMGYWVDMSDPYITYDNKYIETLWHLLSKLYEKGYLYKGYSIQPYSPAAGTGLSTHELNQPGCYKNVKDTTIVAQFSVIRNEKSEFLYNNVDSELFFIAWTTTPWTLPSNTALAVGSEITYLKVKTFNQYTFKPITVILAKDRFNSYFNEKAKDISIADYKEGDKLIPFQIISEHKGKDLAQIRYNQLMPYVQPNDGDAFFVVCGDFVTTEDGTGIVHIAPSFGADDYRTGKQNGIGSLTLVDKQGKFVAEMGEFAGRYVKNAFDTNLSDDDKNVDIEIAIKLKTENKAFKVEKHEHTYPHCWRTDKPILYYPLDSWFIKTTASRDRMIELNKTINWKPESTGTGRFGKWLENLMDWNLSRSRYWGTPLPIWISESGEERICIGSYEQLKNEIEKSVKAGFMTKNPLKDFVPGNFSKENYSKFDPHRPYVDRIILVSSKGEKMQRESDLIDVWFDSGAMPYAQLHYPFENKEVFDQNFPADFIAEGVDQTRGWFFTLHALSTMLFDSVAFKNIISNGLVLDKNGQKMSKRLGNAVDPFEAINKYGSDPLRWYMITNAQPWDNLKFDIEGVDEVKRKFFGTLYNTYGFFALYANVDKFNCSMPQVPINERPELDRWILSLLNTLIIEVDTCYKEYEPTKAGRAIQDFVSENLSNWFIRLSRKRFWGGEFDKDKTSAYQTLFTCLETISILASPIAPFYMDKIFCDLNAVSGNHKVDSVHHANFPKANISIIDKDLEEKMALAQTVSSMILGLRRKVNIKVRQPLNLVKIPIMNPKHEEQISAVKDIILTEVNVKVIEFIGAQNEILVKKIKANFKNLGPRFGKEMKEIANIINLMDTSSISNFEANGEYKFILQGKEQTLTLEDVEITTQDIPGWLVATEGQITIALDVTITESLKAEGLAREIVNRIQNIRKDSGFEVTDKIKITIQNHAELNKAIEIHKNYISTQTLASEINFSDKMEQNECKLVEVDDEISTYMKIEKI